jgi:hypothetical protein
MAQATIKKKTLKIKKPSVASTPTSTAQAEAAPATPEVQMATAPVGKKPSYTAFAILGLVALIMLVSLLIMQYTEFTFLSELFPKPPQAGM